MTGYTKLFGSIITSTIWREKNETRILWITMLALKNKSGIVEGSVPGLADMARLSLDDTIEALETLRAPDQYSRTKEHEGRRIEDVEGGWLVLNHAKWREKMNADERRDYLRVKQQEHRERVNKSVNKRKQRSTRSTHTEPDANTQSSGTSSAHAEFIEKWSADYEETFKEKYAFQGGKDAKAVKALLAASGKTPDELMKMAKAAWANGSLFYCKSAASICGFNSKFNEIRSELNQKRNGTHRSGNTESGRGLGTCNEGKSAQYEGYGRI